MKYMISELAKLLNVSTNTVRRYERFGHIKSERDDNNGYRYYSKGDITRLMSVRVLRKYGFTHNDIIKMRDYSLQELIHTYQVQIQNMDEEIVYLTSLRHRLSDDLILFGKAKEINHNIYIRDGIEYSYILYQSGDKLLLEENRIKKIHEYLYLAPKVQLIYIIRKEDIECDNIVINKGWAIKILDLEKFKIEENDYTERYNSRKTLMCLVKLPAFDSILIKNNSELVNNVLLKEPFAYMKKQNLRLDGDLLGVKIASIIEFNEEMEYVLFGIPIAVNDVEV
jgi:DNA-binding transcriptional MerR regulator